MATFPRPRVETTDSVHMSDDVLFGRIDKARAAFDTLVADRDAARAEVATLRERVATLEKQLAKADREPEQYCDICEHDHGLGPNGERHVGEESKEWA